MDQHEPVTHVRMPVDLMQRTLDYLVSNPLAEAQAALRRAQLAVDDVTNLIGAIKSTADASFAEQQSGALNEPPK